jgi:hypothetical protein
MLGVMAFYFSVSFLKSERKLAQSGSKVSLIPFNVRLGWTRTPPEV